MGIQCRAKDPNSCRVHGTSGSYEKLQAIADRAALSGNTSLYMDMRAQMDALSDEISGDAVEAAASARWSGGRWEKMSAGIKSLARANARLQLEAAAPHLQNGSVSMAAVNAYAKTAWELRATNGKWALATVEDRKAYRSDARAALEAASPHMGVTQNAEHDLEQHDMEQHLSTSKGLNIIYRTKMRSILKSEDNEMPRLKELYKEITRRQNEEGVRLMTPQFEKTFITIYNNNARPEDYIK